MGIGKILRAVRRDQHVEKYASRNRLISPGIYQKLKQRRKCERCFGMFTKPLEIHHKVPVRLGGTNSIENLMVVCAQCHAILDKETEKDETNEV